MQSAKRIAIVGAGPMAIYTIKELIKSDFPLNITAFESSDTPGCGMPYRRRMNADYMFCNAYSKEIPPVTRRLVTWLHDQDDDTLAHFGLDRDGIDNRSFYPRVLIGNFLADELRALCDQGRAHGHQVAILPLHTVVNIAPHEGGVFVDGTTPDGEFRQVFDDVVLATGHSWPKSPRIGSADLISPWPYTAVTELEPGNIGILGSSLSAIDVIVALGTEHGTFHEAEDAVTWFPKKGRESVSVTMVSHLGIMPEPDFFYAYPYEPLTHIHPDAVQAEINVGADGLLARVFGLLIAELDHVAPDYMSRLGSGVRTLNGFADAYFADRVNTGGMRALRETLASSVESMRQKRTQSHRYALLRAHENFEALFAHFNSEDWDSFRANLLNVFSDCYAAIPHLSVRRVLAMHDAGVLRIIPTGEDSDFRNGENGTVISTTVDGDIAFDALIDARGQAAAPLSALPFPSLIAGLSQNNAPLHAPFRLELPSNCSGRVYCLSMPQLLQTNPFSQGLANCHELGKTVANDIGTVLETTRSDPQPASRFEKSTG